MADRGPRLTDFVLLACQFELAVEESDGEPQEPNGDDAGDESGETSSLVPADLEPIIAEPRGVIDDLPGVHLRYNAEDDVERDEFVFILNTIVSDITLPYRLQVVTGSRFAKPPTPVELAEAESTLLFITYPYVRELISSITSRSPYVPYHIPPITKWPDPKIREVDPAPDAPEEESPGEA